MNVGAPRPARASSAIAVVAMLAIAACSPAAPPSTTSDRGTSPSVGASATAVSAFTGASPTPHGNVPLILFTRTLPGDQLATFTIGIDGSGEIELTDVRDCCGTWSPDGSIIAVPDVASSRVLPATLNPDGSDYRVHAIGSPTLSIALASWSPARTRISFEAWDDTDPTRTGLYVAAGSSLSDALPVQITHARLHDVALGWSPDGTRLLLIQVTACPDGDCDGGDLYVVNADGSDMIRLNPEGTFVACCRPASWSPDGTRVTFGAQHLKAAGGPDFINSAVYVAETDGSHVAVISEPGAFTEGAQWSPDGNWIVFNKKSGPVGVKGSDLYLIHPDGSGLHAITTGGSDALSDQIGAVWSPDGRRLLFDSVPGGPVKRGDLWIVNLDGTGLIQVTDARTPVDAWSWQPGL